MANKGEAKKPSHWATKAGLKQVKDALTRKTMIRLQKMGDKKPGDAVSDVVGQLDSSNQVAFISAKSAQKTD